MGKIASLMQLSTGMSFVALVVSIVTLVLVFQVFTQERSEPPKDNSLAWAELLSARAMVTWPTPLNPGYNFAKDLAARTVEKIDQDRAVPKC